jgi:hypothetical protein
MINLLPPATKLDYRYGRINRHLLHWVVVLSLGIVGAALITGVGYIYFDRVAKTYSEQIASTNEQLANQHMSEVQKQVTDISNNLNLVVSVLSNQVLFSGLISQLTTLLPANTNLTGLSISSAQGAIDITASAKTYNDAAQIQVNLVDKNNQLFSKADIISITCSGEGAYPCTIVLRALFLPNNPYIFTSNTKAKS